MYSEVVYLFAETYFPKAGLLGNKEELPSGIKIDQKKLAYEVSLAALLYLKEKGFIDIYLKETKILFIKKITAQVKKLKEDDGSLAGLEQAIVTLLKDGERSAYDITFFLIETSFMPYNDLVSYVRQSLFDKNILASEQKGKVLFVKTYKVSLNSEIPGSYNELKSHYDKAVLEFRNSGELYKKTFSALSSGIDARIESDSSTGYSD